MKKISNEWNMKNPCEYCWDQIAFKDRLCKDCFTDIESEWKND